jgi:hypothetical protein
MRFQGVRNIDAPRRRQRWLAHFGGYSRATYSNKEYHLERYQWIVELEFDAEGRLSNARVAIWNIFL